MEEMVKYDKSRRIIYVDVVAGIMIVWMILGHCVFFSNQPFPFFKYLGFYMPWFFYKSGMFFKQRNQSALLRKDISKLIRYFVVYSIIGWFVWSICGLVEGTLQLKDCFIKPVYEFIHRGSIHANGPLWFLLSLFFVRQCSNFFLNKKFSPLIISIVCYGIGFILYVLGWHNHSWWLGNIFTGLCFFLMGYWLKDKEAQKVVFLLSIIIYGFVLYAYCCGWIMKFPYLYMHANNISGGFYYLLFFPMALAGIIVTNNIFRLLSKQVRFRVLKYIGSNSMYFYVIHWILMIFTLFVSRFFFGVESPATQFTILVVVNILFLPMINEMIKSLKAKYSFM